MATEFSAKAAAPDVAAHDPLVAVDARAELPLGVVDVEGAHVLQPEDAVHLPKRARVALFGRGVVAGRMQVLRIDADRDALARCDGTEQIPDVLEAPGPIAGTGA